MISLRAASLALGLSFACVVTWPPASMLTAEHTGVAFAQVQKAKAKKAKARPKVKKATKTKQTKVVAESDSERSAAARSIHGGRSGRCRHSRF